jgi:Flp pilus assembly protein TadG
MKSLSIWLRDQQGSTAAEFALVLMPTVALIFGLIHFGVLLYSTNRLNFAVEATARCRATSANAVTANPGYTTAPCRDTTTAQQYFTSQYQGAATVATPTVQSAACGWQVIATATYQVSAAIFARTVNLRATACYPS